MYYSYIYNNVTGVVVGVCKKYMQFCLKMLQPTCNIVRFYSTIFHPSFDTAYINACINVHTYIHKKAKYFFFIELSFLTSCLPTYTPTEFDVL
jgi:hypothetical protein